jgi:hypothetical protein
VPASSILVLAYNKSAAEEVQQRLKRAYGIDVEIRTFHSTGFKIYSLLSGAEARSTRVEGNATRAIRASMEQKKQTDPDFQKRCVSHFTRYFDDSRTHPDEAVLKEMLVVERLKPYTALDGTAVRSIAERDIANFFITHAVPFQYEPEVTWCDRDTGSPGRSRTYHPDFYLPTRDVYLEFWGVGKRQESSLPAWFTRTAMEYRVQQAWKREQFAKHKKVLWELDYDDWRAGTIDAKLEALCIKYEIPLAARSDAELIAAIDRLPNQREELSRAVQGAITSAKVAGYDADSFAQHVARDAGGLSFRDKYFFELVVPVFVEHPPGGWVFAILPNRKSDRGTTPRRRARKSSSLPCGSSTSSNKTFRALTRMNSYCVINYCAGDTRFGSFSYEFSANRRDIPFRLLNKDYI